MSATWSPRTWILAAILVVAAVALFFMWRGGGGASPFPGRDRGEEEEEAPFDLAAVHLAVLEGGRAGYDPKGRNLFRYTEPPPSAEELAAREEARRRAQMEADRARRQREEMERRRREQEEAARLASLQQQERDAERLAREGPRPPEIHYSYIGYLGPRNERVAVLLDREGKLLVAKEGEIVEEHFRIVYIGYSYLEMGWSEFEGSKPIPLKEPTG
jgi:hypothetical protein